MFANVLKAVKEVNPLEANPITCTGCAWRNKDGVTCEAFPAGIPLPILLGIFDHHAHYEDEDVSDEGLTFYPEN